MGELLGLGISHHPRYLGPPESFPIVPYLLEDPALPESYREVANWPLAMQREWSNDNGLEYARLHKARMEHGFREVRRHLDDFSPDFVLVWGDDQYENFKEDLVPAFAIMAHQEHVAERKYDVGGTTRALGEPIVVAGQPEAGRAIADQLLDRNFDVAYSYRAHHAKTLPHAFANTLTYLDVIGDGFPYAVLPMSINCYGRKLISHRGARSPIGGEAYSYDPRSPRPARVMELGAAVAEIIAKSDWRVAVIGSSGWSHAFLCEMNHYFWPDVPGDHRLYEAMVAGDYEVWRNLSIEQVERSGLQELLNWCALLGAMEACSRKPIWSEFLESYICNSDVVFAVF